jgi:4-carboxymuconolactone decarboxylase
MNPKDKSMSTDRFAEGMKTRRKVLGDAHVDAAAARVTDFNREWQTFVTTNAWNDVWNRPGLDRRTRSFVVLSILVALRHWDEFRLHVRAALNNGLTKDEIKEVLIQASVYAGVPSANHAFREASAVFAEMK